MSNKLFSMLELIKNGFPSNGFYALDLNGVTDINGFFKDGLRNFHSKIKCRTVCIRTAVSGSPEAKLFLASNIDSGNDELILSVMHKALDSLNKKFNQNDCFIIIHEWIPEEEYIYSVNILPLNNDYIIEAVKGNHALMDRKNIPPFIMKICSDKINILKEGLEPHEILELNRMIKNVINSFILENKSVYELSFIKKGLTFYQIKKPGELHKNPISKNDFYKKLETNKINFEDKIFRKNNYYSTSNELELTRDIMSEFMAEDSRRDF